MPGKIGFQVIYSSGEDERYRATDLNYHGPTVKGWRSAPNCNYPQEITLHLNVTAILHRIQILAHQYLIPQKIEIWTSELADYDPAVSPSMQVFQYLGFFVLSDNKSTGFRSRELKSVTVPATAVRFVKFRLHSNYPNEKNTYNQVALVAINVLGEEVHDWDDYNGNIEVNSESNLIFNPQYTSPYDDLAFEMYVDKEVAKIMKRLEAKKQEAVIEERFEYAKKLKLALEELREAGETLGRYEQEKKQAITVEDYDKAKAKKQQIEQFREEIYASLNLEQLLEIEKPFDENERRFSHMGYPSPDYSPPSIEEDQSRYEETSISLQSDVWTSSFSHRPWLPNEVYNPLCHSYSQTTFREKQPFSISMSTSTPHLSQAPTTPFKNLNLFAPNSSSTDVYHSLPPLETSEPFFLKPEENDPMKSPTKMDQKKEKSSFEAYEDRMLPALRQFPGTGNDIVRECQVVVDQSKKSKLNDRERKQASLPISVFGMNLVEKFYSKHFADKEEGLKMLQIELKKHVEPKEEKSPISPNKIARATILLLHRALRDKVYSVYSLANDTIRLFFNEFAPERVSTTELARCVEKLLPELIAKSGDATPRIHNMAAHTLLSMAECKEIRKLHIIPVHLSRPITSSVHPRLALSRLEMVEQLILNFGISTEKQSGLTCRTLAEFGTSGLHHPAEAVRKVSEKILIHVYKVNPRLVRKQLPPDDDVTRRNLLYRQLFQEFDKIDLKKKKEMANEEPKETPKAHKIGSQIPKKMVHQQTSPMKPLEPIASFVAANTKSFTTLGKIASSRKEHQFTFKHSYSNGNLKVTAIDRRPNMSRISEDEEEDKVHFPMLQKKYVFPTSYIGNSRKSQAMANRINFNSGIPVLNRKSFFSNLLTAKRFGNKQPTVIEEKKICIFCSAEQMENLNIHYWKSCPMLTRCDFCKEVVEVVGLNQHRLEECEGKQLYQECNKCKEAVLKENLDHHSCSGSSKIKCPLCHEEITDEKGWKIHLMGPDPCKENVKSFVES